MTDSIVMDLTAVAQSFPQLEKPSVYRESAIDTVEKILKDDVNYVIIEGEENIGKTTMLAQFAKKNGNNCISYFIKPTNRALYSPDVMMIDFCHQIQWVINKDVELRSDEIDLQLYRRMMYDLHRYASRSGELFFFIIDGMEDIPEEDKSQIGCILSLLWFGSPKFKLIFSGDENIFPQIYRTKYKNKTFYMQEFVLHETAQFYSDITEDKNFIKEVHSITKKPGVQSSIKRIIKAKGIVDASIINGCEIDDIFEQEWNNQPNDNLSYEILAIITYDKKKNTIDDIARILKHEKRQIEDAISLITSISIIDDRPDFRTESFRRFSKRKLHQMKEETGQKIIEDLMSQPDSLSKLNILPGLFEESGKHELLLNYLSPDYFNKVIDACQTFATVRQTADKGIQTALSLKKDRDLMRIGLQRTILTEIDHGDIIRSEIEARMALGEEDRAIILAQGIGTNEEKLHALAVIARIKRSQGLRESSEISEQIRLLFDKIQADDLGEKAYSIAEDLVASNPELAVELIEKSKVNSENRADLDITLAKLSIGAVSKLEESSSIQNFSSKINDPRLKKFLNNLSLLLDEYDGDNVIKEINKYEDPKEALFFLKEWIGVNKSREDVSKVIEFSLNYIVKSTAYSPTARDFRQIAGPIPFLSDSLKRTELVKSLDGLKGTIEKYGPTEEVVRLSLTLAHAVFIDNKSYGEERFVDIFLSILAITDISIRGICLSYFLSTLRSIDEAGYLEERESLHSLCDKEFRIVVKQILDSTANHFSAVKDLLRPLSSVAPKMAIEIAEQLNIQPYRDRSYSLILEQYAGNPIEKWDYNIIDSLIKKIDNYEIFERTITEVLESTSFNNKLSVNEVRRSGNFVRRLTLFKDCEEKVRLCCLCIDVLKDYQDEEISAIISFLVDILTKSWNELEDGWTKINIGFKIVKAIRGFSNDLASKFINDIEVLREEGNLESYSHALNYIYCIYLSIRSFGILVKNHSCTEEDIEELILRIEQIPSVAQKIQIFSVLSSIAFLNGDIDLSKNIYSRKIRNYLDNIKDEKIRINTIVFSAPALYSSHKLSFFEMINSLPAWQKNKALDCVADFILKGMPVTEPFDQPRGYVFKLDYEKVLDLIEIMSYMEVDGFIYSVIERVCDSVLSKRGRNIFTIQQKTKIHEKLNILVNEKMPCEKYIKHKGFYLIAKAKIYLLLRTSRSEWENLITEAKQIENVADRIYVLGMIGSSLPSKDRQEFGDLARDAADLIGRIPSKLDQVGRYQVLADMIKESDPGLSKECMKRAMLVTKDAEDLQVKDKRKEIIDLAHRIDPDYANKLIAIFDDDPARQNVKALSKHIKLLEMKQKLGEEIGDRQQLDENEYSNACWRALSSLNAGRLSVLSIDRVRNVINRSSKMSMENAYPVLCYVAQNLCLKSSTGDQVDMFVRPFFDATIFGAKISLKMAVKNANSIERGAKIKRNNQLNEIIIRPGEREKAIQYIRNWVIEKAEKFIKITDPYFGIYDLDLIKVINDAKKNLRIYIVSSRKQQTQDGISINYEEGYNRHWRLNISEEDPPDVEIIIVGTRARGDSPIHDRWMISESSGIKVGTSLRSIGIGKISDMSELTESGREDKEIEIDKILNREVREIEGDKLLYNIFHLS